MNLTAKMMEAERRADTREDGQRELAINLVRRLLHEPEQLKLFESDRFAHLDEESLHRVRTANPGKLVVKASLIDNYRYEAAMYGAGFHPSQFEAITWREVDEDKRDTVSSHIGGIGELYIHHEPEKIGRANRMYDEIHEEMFTAQIPTTSFDGTSRAYITSEDDLRDIFIFDQANLGVCRSIDMDLLYERENI